MALTRGFKDMIKSKADKDPVFCRNMLVRGLNYILASHDPEDILLGKALIRDYVNATIGFGALAERTGKSKQHLMNMLSEDGNPSLTNLNLITSSLLEQEGIDSPFDCLMAAE